MEYVEYEGGKFMEVFARLYQDITITFYQLSNLLSIAFYILGIIAFIKYIRKK